MNTKIIIIGIAIVLLAALGVWYVKSNKAPTASIPSKSQASQTSQQSIVKPDDTTQMITQDLDSLDLEDTSKDFQDIDASLNNL